MDLSASLGPVDTVDLQDIKNVIVFESNNPNVDTDNPTCETGSDKVIRIEQSTATPDKNNEYVYSFFYHSSMYGLNCLLTKDFSDQWS